MPVNTDTEFMAIEDMIGLRKKNMMFENAEYQRGKYGSRYSSNC